MDNIKYSALQSAIYKHGENLREVFSFPHSYDMLTVCKKLFALENKAQKIMTDYKMGLLDTDTLEYAKEKLFNSAVKILRITHASDIAKNLMVLSNPIDYVFKIHYSIVERNQLDIFKDVIGNGILAPDFRYLTKV